MASIYGYIRTSRRLQEGVPGMDPASQELQLRRAGVPLANIHRDVGVSGTQERKAWDRLNGRLVGGDYRRPKHVTETVEGPSPPE